MNADMEALILKAKESLAAARLLFDQEFYDFAVSRAYYAMFYVAEALLAQRDQSYSSHKAVIAAYGREYAKTAVLPPEMHRWLIEAADFRHTGDYAAVQHVSRDQAEMANDWADKMIATGETYLQEQSEKESEKSTPAVG